MGKANFFHIELANFKLCAGRYLLHFSEGPKSVTSQQTPSAHCHVCSTSPLKTTFLLERKPVHGAMFFDVAVAKNSGARVTVPFWYIYLSHSHACLFVSPGPSIGSTQELEFASQAEDRKLTSWLSRNELEPVANCVQSVFCFFPEMGREGCVDRCFVGHSSRG